VLFALAELFVPRFGALNVFTYITVRAALAGGISFGFSLLAGPRAIAMLRALKAGAPLRDATYFALHERHQSKEGVPTMGGLLMLSAILLSVFLCGRWDNRLLWVGVIMLTTMGALGFADDYLKLRRKNSGGLRARQKLLAQVGLGIVVGMYLYWSPVTSSPYLPGQLELPFLKSAFLPLGILYIPFAACITVGASNGVNLTDGLDGLAIGSLVLAAGAYTGMAYLAGRVDFANYLYITYVPGAGEICVFTAAVIGAGLGFLWFNAHPAQVIMGDTGALALGGALAAVAMLIKQELLLLVVGGIFVLESLSVMIQVASYRWRGGKRVFRMAPLHHHYELLGWSETQVTVRFWIVGALCAFVSLATLKLR